MQKTGLYCQLPCLNCDSHCENINSFIDIDDKEGEVDHPNGPDIFSQVEPQPEPSNDEEQFTDNDPSGEEDFYQP